jgi:hypothetical protein
LHSCWDRIRGSFDRNLSGYGHRLILDDVGGRFVSNQGDGGDRW